ncbi:hypothetical protein QVD17_00187 [Tagetes erecta]|uniref:Reverse transcriptase Ty1/copia-type domain-containing protein n=1 Tax=Tagetes erecta TaxID=13708 RepID=A0AAD8P0D8_TARER|nr:hypothetical protein QVD17_00187 [Tagetes erecta]
MGPQRRLWIYVGYETSSIIRYLEPLTGDVFTARFADCQFDESVFPSLGGENKNKVRNISWCEPSFSYLDPRTKQSVNAPAQVEIPNKQSNEKMSHECQKRLKRGRPIGSKDKNPRKRKGHEKEADHKEHVSNKSLNDKTLHQENVNEITSHQEEVNNFTKEMSINYGHNNILWNQNEAEDIDDIFSYSVASESMSGDDASEPKSVKECQDQHDWDKWKDAMQAELNSLNKRTVFGPIVITPKIVKPVGYKWVFVRKRNEKNEVTRYISRLVAQGFSQRPGIDYDETYSPVMDAITFRYLTSLAVSENLEMRLMDVVTAYLYGSLDSDIYMKIPEGFKFPEALSSKPKEMYSIKLQRSIYGLKQSGRMWYNSLSDYLITVYVDDLNIMGTRKEIHEAIALLKNEFEMKVLGKTKYCLGLQIEHTHNGILVHQSNYTEKLLKPFNMDKANSLSSPMVVRSLNVDKDPFRPCEDGEDILGPEVPYLNAIGALMYLTNCTRPDISFAVNLLARFSYLSDPHKEISHTGFVFMNGGTAISWRSQKQTLVATSSNHAEVIALHEASRECVWLRSMTQHISISCGLERNGSPTPIYEDKAACVSQMKEGYIKSDRTKHIPPRFFSYTQDLIKEKQVEMRYVKSSNNSADLFTKALPTATIRKHVHDIGMRHVDANRVVYENMYG